MRIAAPREAGRSTVPCKLPEPRTQPVRRQWPEYRPYTSCVAASEAVAAPWSPAARRLRPTKRQRRLAPQPGEQRAPPLALRSLPSALLQTLPPLGVAAPSCPPGRPWPALVRRPVRPQRTRPSRVPPAPAAQNHRWIRIWDPFGPRSRRSRPPEATRGVGPASCAGPRPRAQNHAGSRSSHPWHVQAAKGANSRPEPPLAAPPRGSGIMLFCKIL